MNVKNRENKQTPFYCIKTCLPGWLGDVWAVWASTAVLKPVQGQFLTSVQSLLIIYDINEYIQLKHCLDKVKYKTEREILSGIKFLLKFVKIATKMACKRGDVLKLVGLRYCKPGIGNNHIITLVFLWSAGSCVLSG